jgi:glycosyltransferase involved in cell wall biosynthesis
MACGRPVLASHVGDNAVLVKDGENGFLFDPESPEEIAESIQRFACLSMEEKERMGRRNRERAEQMFSPSVFVDRYIAIIEKILQ